MHSSQSSLLSLPTIVITSGEPAGIGPDICLTLMHCRDFQTKAKLIVLGDEGIFAERASVLNLPWPASKENGYHSNWSFVHHPFSGKIHIGKAESTYASSVLAMIDQAVTGCLCGQYDAMVTCPIQKSTIITAGFSDFTGHTEYLAALCSQKNPTHAYHPVMMLTQTNLDDPLRVCLLTTHVPLASVPHVLTMKLLHQTFTTLETDLIQRYGIVHPRIALLGVNPHAGEQSHIGHEEDTLLRPFLEQYARDSQAEWVGPLAADTAFLPEKRRQFDAYLGVYHDQVLPVFKTLSFGSGVNVTLGLPIIRTSVDHGTALSLAGTGEANTGGLQSAIMEAVHLTSRVSR